MSDAQYTFFRYTEAFEVSENALMPAPSLQAKKAYYAKMRRSNYAASLRLEGFDSKPADLHSARPTREELLKIYRADPA